MSSYSNNKYKTTSNVVEEIDLKEVSSIIGRYKASIYIVVFMLTFLAAVIAYFSTNIYQASLVLQIREQTSGSRNTGQDEFMQQALGGRQNNMGDEISILQSTSLASKALQNLQLGTRYYIKSNLRTLELYKDSPFTVDTQSLSEQMLDYKFQIHPVDESHFRLTLIPSLKMKIIALLDKQKQVVSFSKVFTYGESIKHPNFNMVVNKTAQMQNADYFFTVTPNEWMTSLIQDSLNVFEVSDKGSVLTLVYQDNNPSRALDVLSALANAYKEQNIEVKNTSANKKLSFIDKQLADIDKSLQISANDLQLYKSSHIVIDLKEKGGMSAQQINTLETQISELKIQRSILKNLIKQIKSQKNLAGIDVSSAGFVGRSLTSLIEKLQQAYAERVTLSSDYTQKHPSIIKNNRQIASIKKNLLGTIESNLQGIHQRMAIVSARIYRTRVALESIPQEQKELSNLSNSFDVNKKLYGYLLEKRAETAIVESSKVSTIRVIDKASVGQFPIKPKRVLMVLVGIILGFIIGIIQAFLRNSLANTIQSIADIEKHTTLPIYSILPFFKKRKSLYEDALRVLLTRLEFYDPKPKIITITSSIVGEGRATTTIEFAKVISKSSRKVMLLAFDLRRSKIHEHLNLSNTSGISTLLSGESTIEEVIQTVNTNLDVIVAGPVPENTYGLIMSEKLQTVMAQLQEKYDYVIIESPAAGLVADALVLMQLSDLNLIVFKANYSKKDFLKNTNRFVSEHNLENVGIVLNGLDLKKIRPW